MKIFYTQDDILNECNEPCPNKQNANKYSIGTRVGSYYCTHGCKFCYGRSWDFNDWGLFASGKKEKPFVFREISYVKCAGLYKKQSWYYKLCCFIYKYLGKYVIDTVDKINRKS